LFCTPKTTHKNVLVQLNNPSDGTRVDVYKNNKRTAVVTIQPEKNQIETHIQDGNQLGGGFTAINVNTIYTQTLHYPDQYPHNKGQDIEVFSYHAEKHDGQTIGRFVVACNSGATPPAPTIPPAY
jgi:hypothetical protein